MILRHGLLLFIPSQWFIKRLKRILITDSPIERTWQRYCKASTFISSFCLSAILLTMSCQIANKSQTNTVQPVDLIEGNSLILDPLKMPFAFAPLGNHTNNAFLKAGPTDNFSAFVPENELINPMGTGPRAIAIDDLDEDGDVDIVVANFSNNFISIYLNDGEGIFFNDGNYRVRTRPLSLALADLDGINGPDIVTANYGSNLVSVLLNQGDGTFLLSNFPVFGRQPAVVGLGDMDNDGFIDIVTADERSSNVSVLLNSGPGTLFTTTVYTVGPGPNSLALGDVNSDGYLDIMTTNGLNYAISVLLNQQNGTFVRVFPGL